MLGGFIAALSAGYLQMGLGILTQLAVVPVLINAAGKELGGVYLVLMTVANVAAVGIGWMVNAGQRRLIRAQGAGEDAMAVHRALWWTLVLYALGFFVACLIIAAISGSVLLTGLAVSDLAQVRLAIVGLGLFVLASFVAQGDLVLMVAQLRQAEANLWRCVAPVLFLVVLGWFQATEQSRIDLLLLANAAGAGIAAIAIRWRVRTADMAGRVGRPHIAGIAAVFRGEGWRYLLFGLAQFAVLYGDSLLIAGLLGPVLVAEYVIVWRLAEAGVTVLVRASEILGPYLTKLQAGQDAIRLRAMYVRASFGIVAVAAMGGVVYMLYGAVLASWWVGEGQVPAVPGLFVMAGALIVVSAINRHSVVGQVALGLPMWAAAILGMDFVLKAVVITVFAASWGLRAVLVAGLVGGGVAVIANMTVMWIVLRQEAGTWRA